MKRYSCNARRKKNFDFKSRFCDVAKPTTYLCPASCATCSPPVIAFCGLLSSHPSKLAEELGRRSAIDGVSLFRGVEISEMYSFLINCDERSVFFGILVKRHALVTSFVSIADFAIVTVLR